MDCGIPLAIGGFLKLVTSLVRFAPTNRADTKQKRKRPGENEDFQTTVLTSLPCLADGLTEVSS